MRWKDARRPPGPHARYFYLVLMLLAAVVLVRALDGLGAQAGPWQRAAAVLESFSLYFLIPLWCGFALGQRSRHGRRVRLFLDERALRARTGHRPAAAPEAGAAQTTPASS